MKKTTTRWQHALLSKTGTLAALGGLALLSACSSGRQVTIASSAFNTTGSTGTEDSARAAAPADVTDFKFCVTRVRIDNDDDSARLAAQADESSDDNSDSSDDDSQDVRFAPGLIDATNGEAKEWGKITIPEGYKVKGIRVKVHRDTQLCGVDYSVKFNDATTPQDVEFKWSFNPPLEIDGATQQLELSLKEVVAHLREAASSGSLASLKDRIEEVESTEASKR